jgi:glutathione S-transferase
MTAPPLLLHFRISHYNEKIRWALDHKRWPHRREALVPGLHVPRVRRLTRQNAVPVLVLDGKPLLGSADILAEIERRRPDPPLFPADPADRERALAIQSFFDQEVAPDLRRLFWECYFPHPAACARMAAHGASPWARRLLRATFPLLRPVFSRNMGMDRERMQRARERLPGYFERLESEIRPSGYLVGSTFGLADLCAAAVMTAILRPPQFPYPLPEPWPQELVDLRGSVADTAAARWVFGIYERHRPASSEIPE